MIQAAIRVRFRFCDEAFLVFQLQRLLMVSQLPRCESSMDVVSAPARFVSATLFDSPVRWPFPPKNLRSR